jgi:hypothetical protein
LRNYVRIPPVTGAAGEFCLENSAYLLFIAVSPALFSHIGYDLGRFDQLNLLLAITAIVLVTRNSILAAGMLSIAGILIHEAFAVIYLPMIAAITILNTTKEGVARIALLAAFLSVVVLLVFAFGGSESLSLEQRNETMRQIVPDYDPRSVVMLYDHLGQSISTSVTKLSDPITLLLLMPAFLYLLLLSCLYFTQWRETTTWQEKLILLSAFSPLLLFIAGVDYQRWIALTIQNMFLTFAFIANRSGPQLLEDTLSKPILVLSLGFSLLGPLAVTGVFPLARNALSYFLQL